MTLLRPLAVLLLVLSMAPASADEETPPAQPAETGTPYAPRDLGARLAERALGALVGGDLETAIGLYEQWLAADPTDSNGHYNLACAYALAKRTDDALTAFENAIDTGFDDFDHAASDGDLASLRDAPRFTAALARGRAAQTLPTGVERRFLTTETIGTYVVQLPPDYETSHGMSHATYPVCLILHGSGSSEVAHGRFSEVLGRDGVIYVAPRALHPHTAVFKQRPGWTAWPPEGEAAQAGDPARQYAAWILRCVRDVQKHYRTRGDRVFVWGHSQGAGAACVFAALHPEAVAGLFAYAGYYPEEIVTDEAIAGWTTHGVHVTLCHGTRDRVVPHEPTAAMADRMKAAGVAHAVHLVDAGHGLEAPVRAHSATWAAERVRAATPAPAPDEADE